MENGDELLVMRDRKGVDEKFGAYLRPNRQTFVVDMAPGPYETQAESLNRGKEKYDEWPLK